MKEKFRHYHLIENLDEIYKHSIIILDTNSILNIYRYNTDNRNKYLEILKKVTKRIYLTNQICNEFYKNRFLIIESRTTFKDNIYEMISENHNKLLNILDNCSGTEKYNSALGILKHEVELKDSISNNLKKSLEKIKKSIDEFNQDLDITYIQKKDPILDEINQIVGNKVTNEFTKEELEQIYKEGSDRFEKEIPPGYKDKDKDGNEKYNDLVIWKELISLAKEKKKDILFISDDRKEDWAIKFKGKDFGPRTELLKEFIKESNQLFYSISTKRFIEIISSIHSITDTELLIKETENITKNIYDKEREVVEKIKQLKNEREKFEKDFFTKNFIEIYQKKDEKSELKDNSLHSKYLDIIIKRKKDEELKFNKEKELEEIRRKFMWNYLKDNYQPKDNQSFKNNDDENDDDDSIFA